MTRTVQTPLCNTVIISFWVLHISTFHYSNYWPKNLTKNGTRGFGFSDAKCQCIASFCPRGFFLSANYVGTGSGLVQCAICEEQAHSTLLCKLTLHETPNIKGNVLCKNTLHNNFHKHKTQQRLVHTQAHVRTHSLSSSLGWRVRA